MWYIWLICLYLKWSVGVVNLCGRGLCVLEGHHGAVGWSLYWGVEVGVAHLGRVSIDVVCHWVWLKSVSVVCVSVLVIAAQWPMHWSLYWCLEVSVAHLQNLISVSIVVASQWVW